MFVLSFFYCCIIKVKMVVMYVCFEEIVFVFELFFLCGVEYLFSYESLMILLISLIMEGIFLEINN